MQFENYHLLILYKKKQENDIEFDNRHRRGHVFAMRTVKAINVILETTVVSAQLEIFNNRIASENADKLNIMVSN